MITKAQKWIQARIKERTTLDGALLILAGICFSAYTLSSFNLVYKISKKDDVIHFSALNTFIRGFAILLGGILAGLLVESKFIFDLANNYNLIPIHLSMLVSVILRFLSIPILNKIK